MTERVEARMARLVALEAGEGRFQRAACSECGQPDVLAAAGMEHRARCTDCMGGSQHGELGAYAPVVPIVAVAPRGAVMYEPPAVRAPLMVCGTGCAHDTPGPVVALADLAGQLGWIVDVRHSVGGVMGGNGRQLADAQMWSVSFHSGCWAGYAVRRGDQWGSICVRGVTLPPFLKLGVMGLRDWLEEPRRPESWYHRVAQEELRRKQAAKIVKCPGPGECALELVALAFVPFGVPVQPVDHTHRANGDIKIKASKKDVVHGG